MPSPTAGTLSEILAPEGTTVEASAQLATISGGAAATAAKAAEPAPAASAPSGKDVEDAPSAKKMMAEHGIKAVTTFLRSLEEDAPDFPNWRNP